MPVGAQHVECRQSHLEMLRDGPVVERIGGARQLDLAVERLVGDAEQRAVGYAEAEALRGATVPLSMSTAIARDWLIRRRSWLKRSSQLRSS